MIDAAPVVGEHAKVVGSDDVHVETVDGVGKAGIRLTKTVSEAGRLHRDNPVDVVQSVEGGNGRLDRSAEGEWRRLPSRDEPNGILVAAS